MEVRGLNSSATTAPKLNRSFNVKGKEMGISSEYCLEYMLLMIQKKTQVEYCIAMIGWARLS